MTPAPPTRIDVPPGPAGVMAVSRALRSALRGDGPPLAILPTPSRMTPEPLIRAAEAAVAPDEPVADRGTGAGAAVLLATSGSSGRPHGVMIGADALLAAGRLGAAATGPAGLWLTALPVTGIGGLMTVVRAVLAGGDPLPWPGVAGAGRFTPESFVDAAAETLRRAELDGAPAYVSLVPTQIARLTRHRLALETLSRFRRVLVGGAALPDRTRSVLSESGVAVVRTYGSTETCGGCVHDGRPLPGVEVDVDPTDGSIRIAGPTLALGYRGDPDLTRERFTDGGFRSQDIGEWRGDRLAILGRRDAQVKVAGHKVSPPLVSEVIETDPRVTGALTTVVPDAELGSALVAHVAVDLTALARTAQTEQDLRRLVAEQLGSPHVPARFLLAAELPSLPSGKQPVRRRQPDSGTSPDDAARG